MWSSQYWEAIKNMVTFFKHNLIFFKQSTRCEHIGIINCQRCLNGDNYYHFLFCFFFLTFLVCFFFFIHVSENRKPHKFFPNKIWNIYWETNTFACSNFQVSFYQFENILNSRHIVKVLYVYVTLNVRFDLKFCYQDLVDR